MRNRHKGKEKKADGGGVYYSGGSSNVAKEAEKKKKGGAVVPGHKGKKRLDRPGRKRGGGVGADTRPLSSAHTESKARGHSTVSDEED